MKLPPEGMSPFGRGGPGAEEPTTESPPTRQPTVNAPTLIIFGLALLLGLGLDAHFHTHGLVLRRAARMDIALAFALLGAVLGLVAAIGLPRNGADGLTALFSAETPKTVIDRFIRDPMYLGLNALYAAVCLAADKPIALALLPVALIIHFGMARCKAR
jgi:protein-S-isoprenylcysteine O-methyltransferase Ste14